MSLAKTLAGKHKSTVSKTYARYKRGDRIAAPYLHKGERRWLAMYKTKDLRRPERDPDVKPATFIWTNPRSRVISRLQAGVCEYCGDSNGPFEVHHIKKLKDLTGKQNWEKAMIARRRKTMVLCKRCHIDLHRGTLPSPESRGVARIKQGTEAERGADALERERRAKPQTGNSRFIAT